MMKTIQGISRRQFLEASGAAAGLTVLGGWPDARLLASQVSTPHADMAALRQSYDYEMKILKAQTAWGQTPLTSCFFDGCIEKAHDMVQGTKYNILSCGGIALANAIDCMAAVREVVYQKHAATLDEVAQACAANFQGYQRLRAKLQAAPKHGNDDPRLDDVIRLVERLRDEPVKEICRDPRDGTRFGNCHVVRSSAVTLGRATPATPDGRLAGAPVANSVAVSAGCEQSGPTATLNSVCKLNAAKTCVSLHCEWLLKMKSLLILAVLSGVVVMQAASAKAALPAKAKAAINTNPPYRLPPVGIEIPAATRQALEQKLHALEAAATPLAQDPLWADVSVLLKAVRYALADGEFYVPKDVEKAKQLLQLAESRLAELKKHQPCWPKQAGTLARGFISGMDGTPQPIGLEIPADLDLSKPVPLTAWLHGRGDKITDMHFIADRMHKPGQFQPGGCIVLHPFGRQCLGYQLAGEADVLEAIEAVKRMYRIDDKRVLLAGFSMGGAGAWHVGAHYADHWCGLHAGAGFVEVRRFLKLTPAQMPPVYTQTLWGQYEVPDCVRNLFNIPVLAYSGEVDKQKLAADIMAEAFLAEGRKLHHLVGPGMGHKYHPDALKEIHAWAHERMQAGQPVVLKAVHWQGRTLKYPKMFWLTVTGLQKHWEDSRVDAEWEGNKLKVTTKNVTRFSISPSMAPHDLPAEAQVTINGQSVACATPADSDTTVIFKDGKMNRVMRIELKDGRWQLDDASSTAAGLRKVPDLQGPIDDAFTAAFIVVPPDKVSASAVREAFYKRELAYTVRRWREVFRGDLPVKRASDLTADDLKTKNLILFGEPGTNYIMAELLAQTPIAWQSHELKLGARSWKGESIVPLAIYPNPKQPGHYIVLNSGPTIREKSDPNNSLQTPQLPDWAVLDVSGPATDSAPAEIVAAGFFNEQWLP